MYAQILKEGYFAEGVPDSPGYMRNLNEGYFTEIELRSGKYAIEICVFRILILISVKKISDLAVKPADFEIP